MIGETLLATMLYTDVYSKGYKAYFRTMEEIINMLKMKDIKVSAMIDYDSDGTANLIVIDDITLFPFDKQQAFALFDFINQVFEQTSFIVKTDKTPNDLGVMFNIEALASALLTDFCTIVRSLT